mmetsp:Transcript_5864/g.8994  ORF Transcript_5864/g.8994 Transcript_5864/m.8994 type:complete len:260 (+) Transcript_5864:403-1182(+)
MVIPRARQRGKRLSRIPVPKYSDFLELEPGRFMSAVGGVESELLNSYLKKTPNYFISHLDTLEFFHRNGREALAEDVMESILFGMDEPQGSDREDMELKYGKLLRFLWLLGRGVGESISIAPVDATDDPELAERLATIRGRLNPSNQRERNERQDDPQAHTAPEGTRRFSSQQEQGSPRNRQEDEGRNRDQRRDRNHDGGQDRSHRYADRTRTRERERESRSHRSRSTSTRQSRSGRRHQRDHQSPPQDRSHRSRSRHS